jgi:hypothetical protein
LAHCYYENNVPVKSINRAKKKKEETDPSSKSDDLKEMTHDELSGADDKRSALSSSSTDEDEDEGLGDGKIGRSQDDILGRD